MSELEHEFSIFDGPTGLCVGDDWMPLPILPTTDPETTP